MLRQMLINELEKDWGRSSELSLMAGYKNGSSLKKALKKEVGDIEKFDGFVKLVHELFPDTKFELMTAFAKTLSPQKITARFMLEYATIFKLRDMQNYLIKQLEESTNNESNDWAFVYGIDEKVIKGELSGYEAINLLVQRKYSCVEMRVYSKVVQYYCYYEMKNLNMIEAIYNDIKHDIENIKKKFIKDSFYARLLIIECGLNLHKKNFGELREKLFLIENALDPIKTVTLLHVGNSYIMTNHQKANNLYKQAYEIASDAYKVQLKRSINFNNILWGKCDNYLEDDDISNKLFYYAKTGQVDNANEIIKNIKLEEYNDLKKGFHYYYIGILNNDIEMFYKSVEHFNNCGEKFYKQLPIQELKKAGEKSYIINAISA